MLTMAMDLSARTGEAVPLPADTAILRRGCQDEATPSHAASGGASSARDAQAT
jgi:hypothetical protein